MIKEMKQRESNLELMRILCMCVTPAYHMLVYNLILKMPYGQATTVTLLFCVAGAIPANYAFMALSSYFLLESKGKYSIKKFLTTGSMALTLAVLRFAVVRGLFGFNNSEYMIEGFIIRGAWWYMEAYLMLLLLYPFFNWLIHKMKPRQHLCLVAVLFALLSICYLRNEMLVPGDLIAFSFIYFLMGYLRRKDYQHFLVFRTNRRQMAAVVVCCYLVLFAIGFAAKWPAFGVDQGVGNDIVQYVISRYNVLAAGMGVALFFLFRDLQIPYRKGINRVAHYTVYIFLLHETVLAVFWYVGWCWFPLEGRPGWELLGWIVFYTASSFAVSFVIGSLYEKYIEPLWAKLIEKCRRWRPVKWIEEMEETL